VGNVPLIVRVRSRRMSRRASLVLPVVAVAGVLGALALMFFYAPTESVQGEVQRIFYLHVPNAWMMFLAFILVGAASVMVLVKRNDWERWDRIAVAAAEVGLVHSVIMLTTGPIWANKAWGVWWVWDARLTSSLVLFLIYVGYLLFRSLSVPGERRARLAAVIGIIGVLDIPVVHFAVVWWRTQHPEPTVLSPSGPQLPGEMLTTLTLSFVAFAILFVSLLALRMRIESARHRVDTMAASLGTLSHV
jgi:heme exporter protein C